MVRHANAEHYFLQPFSHTFHGRDVLAPVAAWLSKGWQTAAMGEEIQDYKKMALPRPKAGDGGPKGLILKVDSFGNLVTNFRAEDLPHEAVKDGAFNAIGHAFREPNGRYVCSRKGGRASCLYLDRADIWKSRLNKANASKTLAVGRGAAVILPKK